MGKGRSRSLANQKAEGWGGGSAKALGATAGWRRYDVILVRFSLPRFESPDLKLKLK
jgi:hypothetical protein